MTTTDARRKEASPFGWCSERADTPGGAREGGGGGRRRLRDLLPIDVLDRRETGEGAPFGPAWVADIGYIGCRGRARGPGAIAR